MTDIARMRFESAQNPAEKGELVLTSDGELVIEPSEELVDELARLEERAVERSRSLGIGIGAAIVVVGALWALAGWLSGRWLGCLRNTLREPQPVDNVKMFADPQGGVHLSLRGAGPQEIALNWAPGETNLCEVNAFMAAYRSLKGIDNGEASGHQPEARAEQ